MPQPSQTDIISGLDPTGFTSLTGAQLETMVGGATPFTDKGIVMVTTDAALNSPNVPAAQTTTKWQTYLWIRIQPSNAAVSLYAWNPNGGSDPTFLQWQNITLSSIPSGSIQGYQLAPSTITYDKINNLQLSQIIGYQSLLTTVLTPTVQTQISGSYSLGFTINNGVVSLAMLDQTGTSGYILTANGAGVAPSWLNSQIVSGLANPDAGGANDGQSVVVNRGAYGTFKYINPTSTAGIAYTSPNQVITAGSLITLAHGLTAKPGFLRAVLICTTGNVSYTAGQEVDYNCAVDSTSVALGIPFADATNVYFQFKSAFTTALEIPTSGTGVYAAIDIATPKWALKLYARL